MKIPKDKTTGKNKSFAFICFRHSVSVPYAIELLNGIAVFGRNLKVQSRNHQRLQDSGPGSCAGGIHSLDPTFGQVKNYSVPSQPCEPQALLQSPSLLGMPVNNVMAMAQQQMALLNAFQPVPLSMNPLLNAPRERYSDRHGSLNYNRNSPYQRGNYSNDNRSNPNFRDSSYNSYSSNRNSRNKPGVVGDMQHSQGRFDYSRLGPSSGRDHHSPYDNDHHKRHDDRYERQRSGSHHSHYNSSRRSDGYNDRRHTHHHNSRNYRH